MRTSVGPVETRLGPALIQHHAGARRAPPRSLRVHCPHRGAVLRRRHSERVRRPAGRRAAAPGLHRLAGLDGALGTSPGERRVSGSPYPGSPGTAPPGRSSTGPAGPTGTARSTGPSRSSAPTATRWSSAVCRWAAPWRCGWRPTGGREVAGIVLVNPAVSTERKDVLALPVLKHVVPAFPGITNDIKKPGVEEFGYTRTPLRAAHSMMTGWKSLREDLPKVTQPLLMFLSTEDHVADASLGAGDPRRRLVSRSGRTHAGEQLPRGYARQRRPDHLRGVSPVHPTSDRTMTSADDSRDEPTPGTPDGKDLPFDEDAAWRAIVENYGSRPELGPSAEPAPPVAPTRRPGSPGPVLAVRPHLPRRAGRRERPGRGRLVRRGPLRPAGAAAGPRHHARPPARLDRPVRRPGPDAARRGRPG